MADMIIPIENVTAMTVHRAIERSLAATSPQQTMADFVASVDWSGHARAIPAIRNLLGELEAWTVDVEEGGLSAASYRSRLTELLPASARA